MDAVRLPSGPCPIQGCMSGPGVWITGCAVAKTIFVANKARIQALRVTYSAATSKLQAWRQVVAGAGSARLRLHLEPSRRDPCITPHASRAATRGSPVVSGRRQSPAPAPPALAPAMIARREPRDGGLLQSCKLFIGTNSPGRQRSAGLLALEQRSAASRCADFARATARQRRTVRGPASWWRVTLSRDGRWLFVR